MNSWEHFCQLGTIFLTAARIFADLEPGFFFVGMVASSQIIPG